MNDALKKEVSELMASYVLCVISTVTPDAKPESAIVGYSHSENLELLIGTSDRTRKFANIQANANVAVVIGDTKAEIQYEGTATVLDEAEAGERLQSHFAQVPGSSKYRDDPSQVFLLITPTWLRLTIHGDEDKVEEMSFA